MRKDFSHLCLRIGLYRIVCWPIQLTIYEMLSKNFCHLWAVGN
nr:MAG TPA: hypothetical protein [Caudoviricetes sp.]